jgi:hypothetical protein
MGERTEKSEPAASMMGYTSSRYGDGLGRDCLCILESVSTAIGSSSALGTTRPFRRTVGMVAVEVEVYGKPGKMVRSSRCKYSSPTWFHCLPTLTNIPRWPLSPPAEAARNKEWRKSGIVPGTIDLTSHSSCDQSRGSDAFGHHARNSGFDNGLLILI